MNSHLNNPEVLELYIYNGADGEFRLFEENGTHQTLTAITHRWDGKTSVLTITPGEWAEDVLPAERTFTLRFQGFAENAQVELVEGGNVVDPCHYDFETCETVLQIRAKAAQRIELRMNWQSREIPQTDKESWLYDRLHKAQISYDRKQELYKLLTSDTSVARKLAELQAMELDQHLFGALLECLTCDM